jgi:transcriptional regulator with XRE-family HTH domain
MATFGEYIAARRKALKLTQKDMSVQIKKGDGIHISMQYLNDVENGRRKPPSDQIIEQIGAILGIPVEILYFQAERMPADLKRDDVPEKGYLQPTERSGGRSMPPSERKRDVSEVIAITNFDDSLLAPHLISLIITCSN